MRLIYIVNVRDRFCPPLPAGYYGNAIVASAILTTAGKLCQNPIEYALELVKTAKANVSEEYARSLIDLMVIKSLPRLPMVRSYIVLDLTSVRSRQGRSQNLELGGQKYKQKNSIFSRRIFKPQLKEIIFIPRTLKSSTLFRF